MPMASALPRPEPICVEPLATVSRRIAADRDAAVTALELQIDRLIAAIDELLTEQVNTIIHHPRFQALEASWRSLARLVGTAGRNPRIKVRVLDIRWTEVCRDLERAIEF